MKRIKSLGLLIILFGLYACEKSTPTVASDAPNWDNLNWRTLDKARFTVQYPDNFQLDTSGQMGTTFVLLSPQTSSQDLFRENVLLMIQDLTGKNIDLDKYVEISEAQIKAMYTNDIVSKRIQTEGSEYQKFIYSFTSGQYNFKTEQYCYLVEQKAYVLTLTCEAKQFDNYQEVGENIMNSFKIK